MRPTRAICLAVLGACALLGGMLPAIAEADAAPSSLIHDEAGLLVQPHSEELARDLQMTREKAGVTLHIATVPFLTGGTTVRDRALALANQWVGEQPGLVIAIDRGDGQGGIAASAGLWRRYPPDEVVLVLGDTTTLLADTRQPLDARLAHAVRLVSDRLVGMEMMRRAREQTLAAEETRLAGWFAAMLLIFSGTVWAAVALWRRHETRRGAIFFPDVDVGTRLGAPFGGGVIGMAGEEE